MSKGKGLKGDKITLKTITYVELPAAARTDVVRLYATRTKQVRGLSSHQFSDQSGKRAFGPRQFVEDGEMIVVWQRDRSSRQSGLRARLRIGFSLPLQFRQFPAAARQH